MAAPFDLIEEARRLIRFNTVTWSSDADCAVYVGSLMRKVGLGVTYQENRQEGTLFLNVVGLWGKGKHPLLLTTHLDTVDAGQAGLWTKTGQDPWKLTQKAGILYGLGVADTKLDILCKLLALSAFKGKDFKRPLILLGTYGEESGLRGAARFCQGEFPKPIMALVGEPSDLSLVTRHKGLAVAEVLFRTKGLHRPTGKEWLYEVTFSGEAAHSSTPDLGANALDAAVVFLKDLKTRHRKIEVHSWEGGTGHNVIPSSCTVRFSLKEGPKMVFSSNARRRVRILRLEPGWYSTLPWEDAVWTMDTGGGLLIPLEKKQDRMFRPPHLTWNITWLRQLKEGWCLTLDARSLPGQSVQKVFQTLESKLTGRFGHPGPGWQFHLERNNPPLDQKKASPLVKLASAALRKAGLPVNLSAKSGCSEAGLYAKVGIPSVVIGPGRSTGNIHRPNESIPIRQLKSAVRFYKEFIQKACF